MLYIILNRNKQYLSKEIVEKYGLKPGTRTPFTRYKIFEDNKTEKEIASRDQEIYQAPEDDNSRIGQGQSRGE